MANGEFTVCRTVNCRPVALLPSNRSALIMTTISGILSLPMEMRSRSRTNNRKGDKVLHGLTNFYTFNFYTGTRVVEAVGNAKKVEEAVVVMATQVMKKIDLSRNGSGIGGVQVLIPLDLMMMAS